MSSSYRRDTSPRRGNASKTDLGEEKNDEDEGRERWGRRFVGEGLLYSHYWLPGERE